MTSVSHSWLVRSIVKAWELLFNRTHSVVRGELKYVLSVSGYSGIRTKKKGSIFPEVNLVLHINNLRNSALQSTLIVTDLAQKKNARSLSRNNDFW